MFPIPGHPLQARYHEPYVIESKVGEVDYIVKMPDSHKSRQLCHINMLKEYVDRNDDGSVKPVCSIGPSHDSSHDDTPEMEVDQNDNSNDKQHKYPMKLQNSDVLANLDRKLGHLSDNVQCELIHEREDIFPDVHSRTNAADHDVAVGDCEHIRPHTCSVHFVKRVLTYMFNQIDHSHIVLIIDDLNGLGHLSEFANQIEPNTSLAFLAEIVNKCKCLGTRV